ncbi:MAG: hypothetical protein QM582_08400, partial [Micropruina sp.]|uniref:hypothetical protein n=1 Tax=Micropruina sp. TaxID=2737536 RepID=UPI0039E32A34
LPGADQQAAAYTAAEAAALAAAGTPLAAADRYAEAVELARRIRLAPADWLPWALAGVTALTLGGRIDQATAQGRELAAVARRAGEPVLFGQAALLATGPWVPMGAASRRAQLLLGEALEWVPADQTALRVRLMEGYLRAGKVGDPTMLARLGDMEPETLRHAADPDPTVALDALRALHSLTWPRQQPSQRRLELSQRMAVVAARAGSAEAELEALRTIVTAHIELADRLGAAAAAQDYQRRAEASGSVLHRWVAITLSELLAGLSGPTAAAARHAERARALQAGVDPETVALTGHERLLSDAVRDDRLVDLAPAFEALDDEISEVDPLYQLVAAGIAAELGRPPSLDYLEQLWNSVRGTFRAGVAAGLIVGALGGAQPAPEFADELAAELAVYSGGWLPIGGSAGIGPADAHLARLLRRRGADEASARHARLATSVAHRFAPAWVRFTQKEHPHAEDRS